MYLLEDKADLNAELSYIISHVATLAAEINRKELNEESLKAAIRGCRNALDDLMQAMHEQTNLD